MKILVLNGSPKKEKSDTLHITRAFLDGLKEAENEKASITDTERIQSATEIEFLNVVEQRIEYCRGCFSCMKNGGHCVISDDMEEILEKILESDLLILSFPLYCYGMPAPLKALMDRTLPLSRMTMEKRENRYEHQSQRDYSHLSYVMISGCGFPNSKHNFEPAINQFKLMFPHHHTLITVPESPMFNVAEAQEVTKPRLELVKAAGKQYATTGSIEDSLLSKICSPMIAEDIYAKIANGEI